MSKTGLLPEPELVDSVQIRHVLKRITQFNLFLLYFLSSFVFYYSFLDSFSEHCPLEFYCFFLVHSF